MGIIENVKNKNPGKFSRDSELHVGIGGKTGKTYVIRVTYGTINEMEHARFYFLVHPILNGMELGEAVGGVFFSLSAAEKWVANN